jgi:hypothetical protein
MTVETLGNALLANERLTTALTSLATEAVLGDLKDALTRVGERSPVPWPFVLRAASVLCGMDVEAGQDVALRVAQGCLASGDASETERTAAAVLLERMGNRRALELATQRDLVKLDAWDASPVPLQLDVIRRRIELSIPLSGGERLSANPFQRTFWSAATGHRWVSVSAPTSAGKSFIVRSWVAERAACADEFRAAYVVPTRALIEEVGRDLRDALGDRADVYTIPWDAELGTGPREVYVMTQERLHLLLAQDPLLKLDLLFVDEAQKFGDGERGVLLQQVVDDCVRRNPEAQVLMASPLTANPGLLLEGCPTLDPLPLAILGKTVTVNQNLLWADQIPRKPQHWSLQLITTGEPLPIATFSLPVRPQTPTKRLPLVAVALGGLRPGTVVYASRPGDAEKAALQIHDALGPEASVASDPDIAALRDLVRRTIHPSYALSQVLERGVAFHYGSMPQLIRQEVERLFREEKLRYLVCTSTLLEGVNLPCRLLVARNPQKGNGNPMSPGDFWNLAGRAGRWGKEFQGNIVCVDASQPKIWPDPPRRRELQTLTRASDSSLRDVHALVEYIKAGTPAELTRQNSMLEAVFSFLSARLLTTGTLDGLPTLSKTDAPRLQDVVAAALGSVALPASLLLRHAGVGPIALGRLDTFFRAADNWEAFLLPKAESTDALQQYIDALGVCHDILGADFGNDKRQFAIALLITDWMRGRPLAVIINKRLEWLRKNRPQFVPATEIRNVMKDVETVARFQAPKYLGCYLDVLAWHLRSIDQPAAADELPDVSMMLELGVSRTTEVSLMALGLSRTTVVALAEFIADDALSREASLAWLRGRDLEAYPLPALVREEIRRRLTK